MRGARIVVVTASLGMVSATPARAELDVAGVGARALAHAGAATVSADGHAALYYNPAGMARQGGVRAQVGLALVEYDASYLTSIDFGLDAAPPKVEDRAGAERAPWLGAQAGLGDRVVVGAAYYEPTVRSLAFAEPADYDILLPDERFEHPHRYMATRWVLRRRTAGLGVAVRALPWLAVGAAALASDVRLDERRFLWAGAASDPVFDPAWDMAFAARGIDRFVPSGSVGLLAAPEDLPLELGASATFSAAAHLEGPARLLSSRGVDSATDLPLAAAVTSPDARAAVELTLPLVARAGVRWLGSRVVAELGGEFVHVRARDPAWKVSGVIIERRTGEVAALERVPLATWLRPGWAARAAVDVDLVPGFLSVSAGYALARAVVSRRSLSTALPDLDQHTVALGLEARTFGAILTLGVAHGEGVARIVEQSETRIRLEAPFDAPVPVGGGTFDGSTTVVGVGIELDLE